MSIMSKYPFGYRLPDKIHRALVSISSTTITVMCLWYFCNLGQLELVLFWEVFGISLVFGEIV